MGDIFMGKDGKNSKCPVNVDPTDPIVLLSLVKTAVNQSNETFLHNHPQVQGLGNSGFKNGLLWF